MSQQRKRETCLKCQRAVSTCYCHVVKEHEALHHFIILQHPSEKKHPLGTALMAHRGLKNSTLLTGECFDENIELQNLLKERDTYLLYPYEDAKNINEVKNQLNKKTVNFIILDGTWKKARKIYHINDTLKGLPLLRISPTSKSEYKIRKQPKSSGLSTIETVAEVLNQVENMNTDSFLAPFHFLIEKQIESMGQETFEKYYS